MRRRDRRAVVALKAAPPPPPMGEGLVADTRRNLQWPPGTSGPTWNPDLLASQKGGLRIYDDMRVDDQVRACLAFRRACVLGPGWALEPASDDPADREFADLLTADLLDLPQMFETTLGEILTAVAYGFSLAEMTYKLDEDAIRLASVKVRAPHHIEFSQDGYGNVTGVRQVVGSGQTWPYEKFLHYVHATEFDNPYGNSDLRGAYKPWFSKHFIWQLWMIWSERYADPPPIAKQPPAAPEDQKQAVLNILKGLQARSAFTLPHGWEVDLLESGRQPREVFQLTVDRCDLAIAKALLVPEKSGLVAGQVSGGSYSLAEVQADGGVTLRNLEARQVQACVQRRLLVPMAAYRDPLRQPPRFTLLPLERDNIDAVTTRFTDAVTKGVVIADGRDENHIRRLLKFPEIGEREQAARDRLRAQQRTQVQVPGAPEDDRDDDTPPEDDTATLSAAGFWRRLTGPEARADLSAQRVALDELTADLGTAIAQQLATALTHVRAVIARRGLAQPTADPSAVRDLAFRPGDAKALRVAIEARIAATYERSGTQAARELATVATLATPRPGLIGAKARKFFRAKAFWITGLLEADVLKAAQAVLFNAIKGDKPERVVMLELDEVLNQWLPVTDAAGREVNVPARIENIARTNTAEAWNEARFASFTDPELPEGLLEGLQYSAIMDDRVREHHAAWDGVVKPAAWWLGPPDRRPPNGFQCRCQLVPVIAGDGITVTPDDELPADELTDPGFK